MRIIELHRERLLLKDLHKLIDQVHRVNWNVSVMIELKSATNIRETRFTPISNSIKYKSDFLFIHTVHVNFKYDVFLLVIQAKQWRDYWLCKLNDKF